MLKFESKFRENYKNSLPPSFEKFMGVRQKKD